VRASALYNTLQHPATPCNNLQHTALCICISYTVYLQYRSVSDESRLRTATHCNTLQHGTPFSTLTAAQHNRFCLHCNTAHHSPLSLQHSTSFSTQRTGTHLTGISNSATLQHTATHCNTLHCTATHCNSLQHLAVRCNTLQCTAAHCNRMQHTHRIGTQLTGKSDSATLHHTTTHCNTLQHYAAHCNTL